MHPVVAAPPLAMTQMDSVDIEAATRAPLNEQKIQRRSHRRRFCTCTIVSITLFLGVALLLGVAAALTWATLKPKAPKFAVTDVRLVPSTTTAEPAQLEVTLSVGNPNQRIGIHYDDMKVVVKEGGGIEIAEGELKERLYQGPGSEAEEMKVDMGLGGSGGGGLQGILALLADMSASTPGSRGGNDYDTVALATINIGAGIRMSVGSWTSGKSRIAANCRAAVHPLVLLQPLDDANTGTSSSSSDQSGSPPPLFTITSCSYKLKSFEL